MYFDFKFTSMMHLFIFKFIFTISLCISIISFASKSSSLFDSRGSVINSIKILGKFFFIFFFIDFVFSHIGNIFLFKRIYIPISPLHFLRLMFLLQLNQIHFHKYSPALIYWISLNFLSHCIRSNL